MLDRTQRFFNRFRGNDTSHGRCTIIGMKESKNGQKLDTKNRTELSPATIELWEDHLNGGKHGLGLVPIREDSTCVWGAIDIDFYDDFDLNLLSNTITEENLPIILCRSKSGGAHLYLFTSEPVPAEMMQTALSRIAKTLGYPKAEIFPKQKTLEMGDTGNWINLPYYGGENTFRYAILCGQKLSPDDFLTHADKIALDKLELSGYATILKDSKGKNKDTATKRIVEGRSEVGERHDDLLKYIVGLYKSGRDIKEVRILVEAWVKEHHPDAKSWKGILKWAEKHIDPDASTEMFSDLVWVKSVPEQWRLKVQGQEIEIPSTSALDSYPQLRRIIIGQLGIIPPVLTAKKWNAELMALSEIKKIEEMPDDVSPLGMAWIAITRFLTSRFQGKVKDEILNDKPVRDESSERYYFTTNMLNRYLLQQGINLKSRDIGTILGKHDGKSTTLYLKSKQVHVWYLPFDSVEPHRQKEDFDIPVIPVDEF